MSKNLVLSLVLAAALASAVAATANANPSPTANPKMSPAFKPVPRSQHVTLTLVTYVPLISATAKNTLDNMISIFEKHEPNITVNIQTTTSTNGAAITSAVQQDEAAGQTPDVVQSGLDMLRYLVTGGLGAQNLTKIAGPQQMALEWGGKFPYQPALKALGQVNGQQYAIPWVLSTPVLFYNAGLFRKAGLDPSKPPTTWSQLEADALAIKKATGADGLSNCAAGAASVSVDWCTQAVVFSNGGTVMSPDGKQLTWTDPKTVSAIEALGNLGRSGAMVNLSNGQTVQEWAQGKLAMAINSSAAQGILVKTAAGHFQVMSAELPGFGGKQSVPTNSGSALAILAKDPLRQRAAWELIRYLTSPTSFTWITQYIGYAPLRTTLINAPNGLQGWAKTQTLIAPNIDQLKRLVPWQDYPGADFAQIEALLENAIISVAYQGADAKTALSQAQAQAQALLP